MAAIDKLKELKQIEDLTFTEHLIGSIFIGLQEWLAEARPEVIERMKTASVQEIVDVWVRKRVPAPTPLDWNGH